MTLVSSKSVTEVPKMTFQQFAKFKEECVALGQGTDTPFCDKHSSLHWSWIKYNPASALWEQVLFDEDDNELALKSYKSCLEAIVDNSIYPVGEFVHLSS